MYLGLTKLKIPARSSIFVSTGVPVNAQRYFGMGSLTPRLRLAFGFLMYCASSRTTTSKPPTTSFPTSGADVGNSSNGVWQWGHKNWGVSLSATCTFSPKVLALRQFLQTMVAFFLTTVRKSEETLSY